MWGKPLPKVISKENVDNDSEVEDVVDDHAVFMASTGLKRGADSGYDTNSLLEQWRTTKRDDDYHPYDDDLYKSYDMSENLHAICDDLDIMVWRSPDISGIAGTAPSDRWVFLPINTAPFIAEKHNSLHEFFR
ncbi:hypothetical protein Tco_1131136 [Tanacetum coccineum]